jgi:hypothetical protein
MEEPRQLSISLNEQTSTEAGCQLLRQLAVVTVERLRVIFDNGVGANAYLPVLLEVVSQNLSVNYLAIQCRGYDRAIHYDFLKLGLSQCTNLQTLDLSGTYLSATSFRSLLQSLEQVQIHTLLLWHCGLGSEQFVGVKFESTALTTLCLGGNVMQDTGMNAVAEALKGSKITDLSFRRCYFGNAGLESLLAALPATSIRTLDLRDACKQGRDPDEAIRIITRHLPILKLAKLDLRNRSNVGAAVIRALTAAVKLAEAPVTEVLLQGTSLARAALSELEEAFRVKNASSLVLQLSLDKVGEAYELKGRKMTGDVVCSLICTSTEPASRNVPKLLEENMRTRGTYSSADCVLKLVLPDGQLLKETGKPVLHQFEPKAAKKGTKRTQPSSSVMSEGLQHTDGLSATKVAKRKLC